MRMTGNPSKERAACTRKVPFEDDSTTVTSSPTYLTDSCNSDSGLGERCSSEETASGHGPPHREPAQSIDSYSTQQSTLPDSVSFLPGKPHTAGFVIQSKPLCLNSTCEGADHASYITEGFPSSSSKISSCRSTESCLNQVLGSALSHIRASNVLTSSPVQPQSGGFYVKENIQKGRSRSTREIRANPTSLARRKILTKTVSGI